MDVLKRIITVLIALISGVLVLRLLEAFLAPVIGPKLTGDIVSGWTTIWTYVEPGMPALVAIGLLATGWWAFSKRKR